MYRRKAKAPHSSKRILGIDQSLVGYRVVSSFSEGMTAQESAHAHPASAQRPVPLNGSMRVARAARIEPAARAQHGADRDLVGANGPHQELPWLQHRCAIDFQ